jgi:hypothetical protein
MVSHRRYLRFVVFGAIPPADLPPPLTRTSLDLVLGIVSEGKVKRYTNDKLAVDKLSIPLLRLETLSVPL